MGGVGGVAGVKCQWVILLVGNAGGCCGVGDGYCWCWWMDMLVLMVVVVGVVDGCFWWVLLVGDVDVVDCFWWVMLVVGNVGGCCGVGDGCCWCWWRDMLVLVVAVVGVVDGCFWWVLLVGVAGG